MGRAVEGLGGQIAQIGQQKLEAQDKLSLSKANALILKADVTLRQELEKDPAGYATWVSRYTEGMKRARGEASKLIQHNGDRTLFEADADLSILRGSGEVSKGARVRYADAEVAGADTLAADMQDAYVNAKDEATRSDILMKMKEANQGLYEKSFVTAQARDERNRKFADGVITQRTTDLYNGGNIEEARKFFDANRKNLDAETERVLNATLIGGENNRKIIFGADAIMSGGFTVATKTGEPGVVPGIPKNLTVETLRPLFVAQESGGNYTAVNKETGALGAYQIMPETGRNLAKKLGVPWMPKLMKTDSPEARQYQDALGTAMIKTVIKDGGGDPATVFALYYAGPDRKGWGPKTRKYVEDMMGRIGASGGQRPAEHNLNDVLGAADAYAEANGFTPEMRESLKTEVTQRVQRDEVLYQREQRDIMERVLVKADALGDGLTSVSQLGPDFHRLDGAQQRDIRDKIKARNDPSNIKPNGAVVQSLEELRDNNPAKFVETNLSQYEGQITPAEMSTLKTQQRKRKNDEPDYTPGMDKAITNAARFKGMKIKEDDKAEVYQIMDNYLTKIAKTRDPTKQDYDDAFNTATRKVTVKGGIWSDSEVSIYDLTINQVPDRLLREVMDEMRAAGVKDPTDEQIMIYIRRFHIDRIK